jgi:Type IV secretory pathway, VirB3-like protein
MRSVSAVMVEIRHHLIAPALNRPLTIGGVDRKLFHMCIGVAPNLGFFLGLTLGWGVWGGIVYSFLVFGCCFLMAYWLSADDPLFPAVLASAAFQARIYDGLEFRDYGLRWQIKRRSKRNSR